MPSLHWYVPGFGGGGTHGKDMIHGNERRERTKKKFAR
jgi:hypothetical protein